MYKKNVVINILKSLDGIRYQLTNKYRSIS